MPISASGGWAGHGVTSDPVTRPTSAIDQVSLCPASPGLAASPVSACGHVKVSASARAGSPPCLHATVLMYVSAMGGHWSTVIYSVHQ